MFASLLRSLGLAETPRWRVGDRYADVPLVNQFGDKLRFHADLVRGRAVVVNSMFTTCRGSCPVTSGRVEDLRKRLSPVFGAKLSFVSFTLEPAVDTPAKLREYAAAFGADRPAKGLCDWHFLTGDPKDVERLRRSLGMFDLDPRVDRDPARHAATLTFGNAVRDRWATLPAGLPAAHLADTIRRVAGFTHEQRFGIPG